MATNILSSVNDVSNLTKITMNANAANAQRQLDLTAKKELISIASNINNAAGKGLNMLKYNLSSSITSLNDDNLKYTTDMIEADLEAAQYTFVSIKKKEKIAGYNISWPIEEENTEPETSSESDLETDSEETQPTDEDN